MAVIPSLMIAGTELQDILVDKAGNPLVNGTVTLTIDTSRLTLKNWYYQTGSPGSYTFVALDNPLTLSAAGTIQDPSGNDTIPFFYPYDESDTTGNPPIQKYYITVDDELGNRQFDRQNFPYNVPSSGTTSAPNVENVVINNEFWRNIGTSVNPFATTNTAGVILAPSQHDGFRLPDMQYIVVGTGDTETLTFSKFSPPGQTLTGDVTPEFYLDFNCTVSTGGETSKIINIPISLHLLTLGGLAGCGFTIQAKSPSASNLVVKILADYGTNGASPAASTIGTIPLNNSWTKYTIGNFTFPPSSNSVSATGDDAFYLQLVLPNTVCEIQIAKPSIFLSTIVPTNDFATYDEIDSIINDFRTGDVRTSLNSFSPYGWVPANDGSIALTSGGTTRNNVDTWPLYNFLWNNVNNTFAPVAGGRGASAYADFTGNKAMTLPLMLGRALLGLPPATTFTYVNGTGIFTVTSNALFDVGSPIYMTNTGGAIPNGFALNTVYYAIPIAGSTTTLQVAQSYTLAIAGIAYVPASDNGSGTNSFNWSLGGSFGEKQHIQLVGEVAAHTHPLANGASVWSTGGGSFDFLNSSINNIASTTIANNTPASAPFNIVQPSTYLNIFFKL